MLLTIAVSCSNPALASFLTIMKRIMLLIQIIVPILLIIFGSIGFISMAANPDQKNGLKKVFNKFFAAFIVFMIPVLVNVVMGLVGDNTHFSSCWNNASDKTSSKSNYINPDNSTNNRTPVVPNSSDYEHGK